MSEGLPAGLVHIRNYFILYQIMLQRPPVMGKIVSAEAADGWYYSLFSQYTQYRVREFEMKTDLTLQESLPRPTASFILKSVFLIAMICISAGYAQTTIKFTDITDAMNVRGYLKNGIAAYGHGAAMADITGDSLPEILVTNAVRHADDEPGGGLLDFLYISHKDGAYTEEATLRGSDDRYGWTGSHGIIFFDYNNDGLYDIFNATTDDANRLYRNRGDATFEDVSAAAGIPAMEYGTRGVIAVDINRDGWLDLYGVNWGPMETFRGVIQATPPQPNELYINNGDGTFTAEPRNGPRGLTFDNPEKMGTQGVSTVDIDNDGDMDIYVCHRNIIYDPATNSTRYEPNNRIYNQIFVNDGRGYFKDETVARGLAESSNDCNGVTFADYDNDGDLDAFVVPKDEDDSIGGKHTRIYKNDGKGFFTKIPKSESNLIGWGFTAVLFDVDNDADLDYWIGRTQDPNLRGNALYINDGTGKYTELPTAGLNFRSGDPRGAASGDIDNDGDLDLFFVDANKQLSTFYHNYLMRNDSENSNRWLKVGGRGPRGDMGAFGTKIWLFNQGHMDEMNQLVGYRQIQNGYGYLAQDDPVQHFGLGSRDAVDLKIMLLDSTVLKLPNVSARQRLNFTKPANLTLLDGDGQFAQPGSALAAPLRVVVRDAWGQPALGVPVTWRIVSGGGALSTTGPVYTDQAGVAAVSFVTAPAAGPVQIQAASSLLPGALVTFTATAGQPAGVPHRLDAIAGSGQTGRVAEPLAAPLSLQVVDYAGAAAASAEVLFEVIDGGGAVNGAGSAVVAVNPGGVAAANWRLGTLAGTPQRVRATVIGHPTLTTEYTATAVAGPAALLQGPALTTYSGTAGQILPMLTFKVLDTWQNPVANTRLTFTVTAGGGQINGQVETAAFTDARGQISVSWRLGPASGENNNRLTVTGAGLSGSPLLLTASAAPGHAFRLLRSGGDGQSALPGTQLPQPLAVIIQDSLGNPVAGHPVRFAVTAGDGRIDGAATAETVSDAQGRAGIRLTLGASEGTVIVECQALWQSRGLLNSPLSFTATAVNRRIDPARSTLALDKTTATANGRDRITLRYVARDAQGAVVPGMAVHFTVSGDNNMLEQSVEVTDGSGLVTATLRSTRSQRKVVHALSGSQMAAAESLIVRFLSGPAATMQRLSGDLQSGTVASPLPLPLAVVLADSFANPAGGAAVIVSAQGPDGVTSALPALQSDSTGTAAMNWTLGSQAGAWRVRFAHAALPVMEFQLQALAGAPALLLKSGGDQQQARAGNLLPAPLTIVLQDRYGNPVGGKSLLLSMSDPAGQTDPAGSLLCDESGMATLHWRLGVQPEQHLTVRLADDPAVAAVFDARIIANQLPVLVCPEEWEAPSGSTVRFAVSATDGDGDPVTLTAGPLPAGAWFAPDSGLFVWPTDSSQTGDYSCTFFAGDSAGGLVSRTTTIHLLSANRPPTFTAVTPADTLLSVVPGSVVNFLVEMDDPDADYLTIKWLLNGMAAGSGSAFRLFTNRATDLVVQVSDGRYTIEHRWRIEILSSVAVDPQPADFGLQQNYPNPANPGTTISFSLPQPAHIRLALLNSSGQQLRVLSEGMSAAGVQRLFWDGRDERGQPLPSGLYFYELQANGQRLTRKLLLLR